MSAFARFGSVVAKELKDTFRDRRTVLVTLVTAVVAGPIFLALILNMGANQADKARELKLPVDGATHAPALIAFLQRQQVAIEPAPADYESRIKAGELDVVLRIDAEFENQVAAGNAAKVKLVYDRSRDRARAAIDQAESLLGAYSAAVGHAAAVAARRLAAGRTPADGGECRSRDAAAVRLVDAVPGCVLWSVRIDDGRHGSRARRERRRARARLTRALARDAAVDPGARRGQVGGDRGIQRGWSSRSRWRVSISRCGSHRCPRSACPSCSD